ncbi:hypothetical protein [Sphingobium sp. BS19]|uniref:hypothetical protein n=1 Tax=Sphingobium sp. BS19 TaxID=3018973 RepID=UPI0022EE4918|nr:hypothetical protein [Sphingobium sp. BS19]GLJ00025.1 hypothetical protein Sbs19_38420 [Sphingobium sp. BS19]
MVAPSVAPVEWVRYAQGAAAAVTALLQADNEAAVQLRAYLDQTRPAPDQPTAPLIVKLWVAKDRKVSKIDFTPFSHPAPNADLRALLVGQRLPGMLPKGMLLPLRIAVQLDTLPAAAPVADPGPNSV